MSLFAFILGREYKLSLAELIHVFGQQNLRDFNEEIAIFELEKLDSKAILTLGGTTRIIQIMSETTPESFATDAFEILSKKEKNSKFSFALAAFGLRFPLADAGMRIKKTLTKNFSVRLLNAKNENIHSAVFKREKLAKTGTEISLIHIAEKNYLGFSLACQDIDAYSRRDTAKNRDMVTGMMPPKLVQMMINFLSENTQKNGVYDPFCGLGTTLIEAVNRGITTVFGSDISREMVANSEESLHNFVAEEKRWQERIRVAGGVPQKDFSNLVARIFPLDATIIEKAFVDEKIPKNINIISEGYLGRIMRKEEMTQDIVFSERRAISRLYEKFFQSLARAKFSGEIVMSFPFWKVQNVYVFLENISEIVEQNGFKIESLLPRELELNTKNGSLLYRRESQNVGREIIKIVKK